jgi:DNA excision repair protein ERCC-2
MDVELEHLPESESQSGFALQFPLPGADGGESAGDGRNFYSVSVRDLVDWTLRTGDLGGGDFINPFRALEGIRAHQRIQRQRPHEYDWEVPIRAQLESPEVRLIIEGRIDGLMRTLTGVLIEEIKSIKALPREPDPLHWAQLRMYGFLYAEKNRLDHVELQLTYVTLRDHRQRTFHESHDRSTLSAFFEPVAREYMAWITRHSRWLHTRNESIRGTGFPFEVVREGQERLMNEVSATLDRGGRLFAEAPTGIGKTMSVLFPTVKRMGEGKIDRIYYLSAKTTGKEVAENALRVLRGKGLRIRALTMTAKEKICFNDGRKCDLATCPFALGFYDRVRPALDQAMSLEELSKAQLLRLGETHRICPSRLGVMLAPWVDLFIGDYNYAFDPGVRLKSHFEEGKGDHALLVDESHNLVDRGREMFSAELSSSELRALSSKVRTRIPKTAARLDEVLESARVFLFPLKSGVVPGGESGVQVEGGGDDDRLLSEIPESFLEALEHLVASLESWFSMQEESSFNEELVDFYFRLLQFVELVGGASSAYATIFKITGGEWRLRQACLNPAGFLQEYTRRARLTVFFSATLSPLAYHRQILGGDSADGELSLRSPFDQRRLAVFNASIPLTYRRREGFIPLVIEFLTAFHQQRPGNYLYYFPSFEFLRKVEPAFRHRNPGVRLVVQKSMMSEEERTGFVQAFHEERRDEGSTIGFAVLGGAFGEGIDLVGERLIGAAIVGVGLPQISLERNLIARHHSAGGAEGFDFAYTYPGINRVLQAAGRVIRSEGDRGAVLLLDERYATSKYEDLLPGWWNRNEVENPDDLADRLRRFWDM